MACLCNGGLFPRLFWTQSTTDLDVPIVAETITPTEVLRLEPITTLSGDEVKLDSMVELSLAVAVLGIGAGVTGITYRLERSTNGGAFTPLASLDIEPLIPILGVTSTTSLFPNLTWVDVPGVGTHIYRIVIETDGGLIAFVTTITAETRALNALVVREA
ncbi:hypothetical protein B0I26_102110 [Anoxybacillus vitaminiphilus]|uniref:Uncharacterized protein n=1 Tax=Paranoxybacillus vitaminiphilus TaxID=581036 RepID=A0A327YNL6_9BACL|nr:hypothetical protein [Anoxybacillus vitaminiphilus]RAK22122.1 hypothetical protein B0I26_102110 [Anoxybacillus vitaminiphilus]